MALIQQAQNAAVCTPSDVTKFTQDTALFVGIGGDVAIICWGDTVAVTLKNVASGTTLAFNVRKVMATNTTATNIILLTNQPA